jgi:UAA transporter family
VTTSSGANGWLLICCYAAVDLKEKSKCGQVQCSPFLSDLLMPTSVVTYQSSPSPFDIGAYFFEQHAMTERLEVYASGTHTSRQPHSFFDVFFFPPHQHVVAKKTLERDILCLNGVNDERLLLERPDAEHCIVQPTIQQTTTTTTMGFLSSTTTTTTTTNSTASVSATPAANVDDADAAAGQYHLLQRQQQQQQQRQLQQQHRSGSGISMSSALSASSSTESMALLLDNKNKQDDSGEAMIAPYYYETPPVSGANSVASSLRSVSSTLSLNGRPEDHPSDLEFFEDLVSEPVLVLGVDISHLSRQGQFIVCAMGLFGFSLLYGYLQELISVQLCNRQLGLFLAMMQFSGYTLLAYVLRSFVYSKQQKSPFYINQRATLAKQKQQEQQSQSLLPSFDASSSSTSSKYKIDHSHSDSLLQVPLYLYLGLSLLRAVDLAMTNMAMQYINYPAKTLMKSSRVVFTMIFGVVIARKSYQITDYAIVVCMVFGLVLFMHADANSSAVFDISGVAMLTVSLLCDGAISNMSESIMTTFGVGQDEVRCVYIRKPKVLHSSGSRFLLSFPLMSCSLLIYLTHMLL